MFDYLSTLSSIGGQYQESSRKDSDNTQVWPSMPSDCLRDRIRTPSDLRQADDRRFTASESHLLPVNENSWWLLFRISRSKRMIELFDPRLASEGSDQTAFSVESERQVM